MLPKKLPWALLIIVFFFGKKVCHLMQNTICAQASLEYPSKSLFGNQKKRSALTALADDFLGKKYQYAGKTPKTGFDCSGFTYFLMKNVKMKIPASAAAQSKRGQRVSLAAAQPGDLVFFQKGKNKRIFHVAMVYSNSPDDLRIIHSTSSRGVVIDELYASKYWEPKISHVMDVLTLNRP